MMKQIKFLALGFCALLISGCQTWDGMVEDFDNISMPSFGTPFSGSPNDPHPEEFIVSSNCPRVQIVDELSTANEFSDLSEPQDYNLISSVRLSQVESACAYSGKSATVDLKLAFEGALGAKGMSKNSQDQFYSHPFFVAVVAPSGNILAKEIFSASMTYNKGQATQTYYENLKQIIPIADQSRGERFKVLVGFQLGQEQLAYNRGVIKATQIAAEAARAAEQKAAETAQAEAAALVAPASSASTPTYTGGPIDITAP